MIKIITDSCSDISKEQATKHNIDVMNFYCIVDEKQYRDGVDFTSKEFYTLMDNCKGMPTTSQVLSAEIKEVYEKAYKDGYKELIYVSISSTGSAIVNNAIIAKREFEEENPTADFKIHLVDSRNYSVSYGYPTIQAAIKASKGASSEEILAYLKEWFDSAVLYIAPFNLDHMRKSGRFAAIDGYTGESMGIRPIMCMIDGGSQIPEKVRGEKAIIPKLVEMVSENIIPQTPYICARGSLDNEVGELAKELTKKLGYAPEYIGQLGCTIATHMGHKCVAVAFKNKNR
jgi:DegV family protein with EDD domain